MLLVLAASAALAVPFVPQREDTCGPAALAMVLRYWGQPVMHDELAAELLEPGLHGVAGSRLAELARERGLRALVFGGDLDRLREAIAGGHPLVVTWSTRAGRFHDVVVVGIDGERVLVHDPARGAGRSLSLAEFDRRWAAAGRWTLLVAPPVPHPPPTAR